MTKMRGRRRYEIPIEGTSDSSCSCIVSDGSHLRPKSKRKSCLDSETEQLQFQRIYTPQYERQRSRKSKNRKTPDDHHDQRDLSKLNYTEGAVGGPGRHKGCVPDSSRMTLNPRSPLEKCRYLLSRTQRKWKRQYKNKQRCVPEALQCAPVSPCSYDAYRNMGPRITFGVEEDREVMLGVCNPCVSQTNTPTFEADVSGPKGAFKTFPTQGSKFECEARKGDARQICPTLGYEYVCTDGVCENSPDTGCRNVSWDCSPQVSCCMPAPCPPQQVSCCMPAPCPPQQVSCCMPAPSPPQQVSCCMPAPCPPQQACSCCMPDPCRSPTLCCTPWMNCLDFDDRKKRHARGRRSRSKSGSRVSESGDGSWKPMPKRKRRSRRSSGASTEIGLTRQSRKSASSKDPVHDKLAPICSVDNIDQDASKMSTNNSSTADKLFKTPSIRSGTARVSQEDVTHDNMQPKDVEAPSKPPHESATGLNNYTSSSQIYSVMMDDQKSEIQSRSLQDYNYLGNRTTTCPTLGPEFACTVVEDKSKCRDVKPRKNDEPSPCPVLGGEYICVGANAFDKTSLPDANNKSFVNTFDSGIRPTCPEYICVGVDAYDRRGLPNQRQSSSDIDDSCPILGTEYICSKKTDQQVSNGAYGPEVSEINTCAVLGPGYICSRSGRNMHLGTAVEGRYGSENLGVASHNPGCVSQNFESEAAGSGSGRDVPCPVMGPEYICSGTARDIYLRTPPEGRDAAGLGSGRQMPCPMMGPEYICSGTARDMYLRTPHQGREVPGPGPGRDMPCPVMGPEYICSGTARDMYLRTPPEGRDATGPGSGGEMPCPIMGAEYICSGTARNMYLRTPPEGRDAAGPGSGRDVPCPVMGPEYICSGTARNMYLRTPPEGRDMPCSMMGPEYICTGTARNMYLGTPTEERYRSESLCATGPTYGTVGDIGTVGDTMTQQVPYPANILQKSEGEMPCPMMGTDYSCSGGRSAFEIQSQESYKAEGLGSPCFKQGNQSRETYAQYNPQFSQVRLEPADACRVLGPEYVCSRQNQRSEGMTMPVTEVMQPGCANASSSLDAPRCPTLGGDFVCLGRLAAIKAGGDPQGRSSCGCSCSQVQSTPPPPPPPTPTAVSGRATSPCNVLRRSGSVSNNLGACTSQVKSQQSCDCGDGSAGAMAGLNSTDPGQVVARNLYGCNGSNQPRSSGPPFVYVVPFEQKALSSCGKIQGFVVAFEETHQGGSVNCPLSVANVPWRSSECFSVHPGCSRETVCSSGRSVRESGMQTSQKSVNVRSCGCFQRSEGRIAEGNSDAKRSAVLAARNSLKTLWPRASQLPSTDESRSTSYRSGEDRSMSMRATLAGSSIGTNSVSSVRLNPSVRSLGQEPIYCWTAQKSAIGKAVQTSLTKIRSCGCITSKSREVARTKSGGSIRSRSISRCRSSARDLALQTDPSNTTRSTFPSVRTCSCCSERLQFVSCCAKDTAMQTDKQTCCTKKETDNQTCCTKKEVKPCISPIDVPQKKISPIEIPKKKSSPIEIPKKKSSPIEVPKKKSLPIEIPIVVPKKRKPKKQVPKEEKVCCCQEKCESFTDLCRHQKRYHHHRHHQEDRPCTIDKEIDSWFNTKDCISCTGALESLSYSFRNRKSRTPARSGGGCGSGAASIGRYLKGATTSSSSYSTPSNSNRPPSSRTSNVTKKSYYGTLSRL